MHLAQQWLTFPAATGPMRAYLARPEAAGDQQAHHAPLPLPGIVLIQEIWGVDEHIADLAGRFAACGYTVLAPDLYSRGGERPPAVTAERVARLRAFLDTHPAAWGNENAFTELPDEERALVTETRAALFGGMRDASGWAADLAAAARWLRARPECAGRRVGSVGYCMGGMLSAMLAAADPDLAAAVIYYGTCPAPESLAAARCPIAGFYGGLDHRISDQVPGFADALRAAGRRFEYKVYEGAPHAFFNDTRPAYHIEAARDAWARTLGFFNETIA